MVATLQQREYELLRSEQLARVGQMAAGLAHELRNPLMPMKMLVQAALQPGATGQLSPRSLQILNDEILRLEHTIQGFLDFARPRLPIRSKTNLGDFLTTKETGTGLGLSICQQIAVAHDGQLRAQNRTDCTGAEFKLLLPITTK